MYDFIRYRLVPPVFLVVFTGLVQVLTLYGRGRIVTLEAIASGFRGNAESWTLVSLFIVWAFIWLKIPGQTTKGPPSPTGFVPVYKDNGLSYYFATMAGVLALELTTSFQPSSRIYELMPQILGTLNVIALTLCFYLFLCPSDDPEGDSGLPGLYVFYRGRNFHPTILGVDVKQLTNCRIGLMAWQVLVWAFFMVSIDRNGFSLAAFTTFVLQTAYLIKFFYWEGGYFHTIDIILDRAGYYICWGCLVWVPCFYTFTSYYLVHNEPVMGNAAAACILAVGLASIYLNYTVDAQKQEFRESEGKCKIWGRPAEYITAFYVDHSGAKRKSLLLTSGFWGEARHLNYDFELALTLCWCLPGWGLGPGPFFYFIFLFGLLVHRVFRDEEKCKQKYGLYFDVYCKVVPYRMIPGIF
ncbi:7-dehydrocholesterol reductase [Nesidiocoris tenuis]|uniref:7-dehydrocholesterol reductase n=1 Tax=Nesidiocoris tenuis TaxID=355587 RepID=A0ABN7B8R8_9HEMI|nr:7-dehydrocholesterol reductase [Nesidiocoris tenuis]